VPQHARQVFGTERREFSEEATFVDHCKVSLEFVMS
jgi:hypothetical protein